MHVSKSLMGQRLKFRRRNQTPPELASAVCTVMIYFAGLSLQWLSLPAIDDPSPTVLLLKASTPYSSHDKGWCLPQQLLQCLCSTTTSSTPSSYYWAGLCDLLLQEAKVDG